jgi:DNA helicase IV
VLGSLLLPVGARRFRIDAARLEVFRQEALTGGRRWNAARDRLAHRLAGEVRRGIEDAGGAMTDRQLTQLTRSAPVREFLDAVWPALDADRVLLRLYTDAAFRAGCGAGLLSPAEQQALAWTSTPRSARSAPWTHADLVLLDELAGLIAGPATYVHLVVDEAQDLSAMQCRAVGRRAPRGSVTVLGDQAQATTPWATGSWKETMQHLGHPDADVVPLTAGYRVPMPVLELANRLLPHIAPEVPPATSIRSGERALSYAPANRLTEVVAREAAREGSLAIIGPDDRVAHLLGRLRGAGVDAVALADEAPSARAVVVPAGLAKGLEYDSVVLVEPAAVVASAPTRAGGLRLLYVTLTRAVSHLVVVHDRPLPAELA